MSVAVIPAYLAKQEAISSEVCKGDYHHGDVMSLPHVNHGILEVDLDNPVFSLLQLIEQHGLQDSVSVWRAHRHFDIKEGEQIISTLDEKNQGILTHVTKCGEYDSVPANWSLNHQGQWKPVQFWSGPKSDLMKNRAEKVMANKEFLAAYEELVTHMNKTQEIGLALRIDDILPSVSGQTLVEGTRDDYRYQLVKLVKNEDVDAHFGSSLNNGVLGKLRITHWPHEALHPKKVGCQSIGCISCGSYGCCYNHWPSDQAPERNEFANTHIPRFFELLSKTSNTPTLATPTVSVV